MARYDKDRRDVKSAYGRYSASDQGDERRYEEQRHHGVYGYRAGEGPGYERELDRHDLDHHDDVDRYNSGYGRREYGYRGQGPSPSRYEYRQGGDDRWSDEGRYGRRGPHGYREAGGFRAEPHEDSHRGRGPKGYRRSDDRIREDVCDALTDDPYVDASDVEVAVKDGEVTLTGTVDERAAKHVAEDLADRVSGVRHVQNNLRVARRSPPTDATPLFPQARSGRR